MDARVVFPRRQEAARKVATLQIKTIPSFLCDFSSCEISWIWRSDIQGLSRARASARALLADLSLDEKI